MVRYLAWVLAVFVFTTSTGITGISPIEPLTPAQLELLSGGKPLVLEKEIPGHPWPELTIWQIVPCSPEELAGVFWDSELDTKYLPGCLEAKILSRPKPSLQKARFKLGMPLLLPDEVYVSDIELIPQPPGSYKITWKVLESVYAKSCSGEIEIHPHAGGKTLMRYTNFMEPKSRIATLLKASGRARVAQSVQALVSQTGREVKGEPALLARQRAALDLATAK